MSTNAARVRRAAPSLGLPRKLSLVVAAAMLCAWPARSTEWPSGPVTVMVPFGAGSTPDVVARMVAERLQARLGQPFVVENRPGASGNLGTGAVARAEPDGQTIGVSIVGPLALNTLLFARMPYNPATDLAYVTVLTSQPSVLAVNKDLGVRGTEELVALVRRVDRQRFRLPSRHGGDRAEERRQADAHSL